MTFDEFWEKLLKGGKSSEGHNYKIIEGDRLHILSPGNTNKSYHITKKTVRRYFEKDIPEMTPAKFRYSRSAYFYDIYLSIADAE